jgi:hypothetical protein
MAEAASSQVRSRCREEAVEVTTTVRWVVVVVLSAHALIHLLGAAKGFGWAEVSALRHPVGPTAAAVWLGAALLLLATAAMVAARAPTWWWAVAALAALVSQAAIVTTWSDARAGTAANVVVLLVAAYGFVSLGPPSLTAEWEHRTQAALAAGTLVTQADLAGLPEPVARYLRRSGAVGLPRVGNVYAEVHGRIRSGPDQPWMRFTGRQLNTYGVVPQRFFHLDATMHGLPVSVLHVFDDRGATMRGRLLSVIPVVDAAGPEMDRSETVTIFNDLVVLAPAALVDAPVQWTQLGPSRVRARYTRAGQSITAELVFGPTGDLVDFVSDDRSRASADGSTFTRLPWSTPLTRYADVRGRRLAVAGTATWDAAAPEGRFAYIDLRVDDLACNVTTTDLPREVSSARASRPSALRHPAAGPG